MSTRSLANSIYCVDIIHIYGSRNWWWILYHNAVIHNKWHASMSQRQLEIAEVHAISQLPNKFLGHFATPLEYVISLIHSSENLSSAFDNRHWHHCAVWKYHSYKSKWKSQNKGMQSRLIWLIRVVFSKGAMLSVSDKYDSVSECTREISELIKLHIQGVWQNAHKFIGQLAHMVKCILLLSRSDVSSPS